MWLKTTDGNWVNMDHAQTVIPVSDETAGVVDHHGDHVGYLSPETWLLLDKYWTKELEWMRKDAEYVEENESCG